EHVGDAARLEPAHRGIIEEAAGEDDAGHAARAQSLQVGALPLGVSVGVAEQDAEPALPRGFLETLEDAREEAVGDVRDDHGEYEALPGLEPARHRVRLVARLLQHGLNPTAGGSRNPSL